MSFYHQPSGGRALFREYFHHVAPLGQLADVKQYRLTVSLMG